MRILIDADGVMLDFVGAVSELGVVAGFAPWDGRDALDKFYAKELKRMKARIDSLEFHERAKPFEGVPEWLEATRKAGHKLVAVTAPWQNSSCWHRCRVDALKKLGFHEYEIIFACGGQKQFVEGEMLIEDRVDTLLEWGTARKFKRSVLIAHPHNEADRPQLEARAKDGWFEVVERLAALEVS